MLHLALLATAALAQDRGYQRKLVEELSRGDWNARIHAVHELEFLGEDGRDGLAMALGDADWQVRMAAAYSLGPLGADGVKLLKVMTHDPCPVVRLVALHTLGGLVPDTQEIQAITEVYGATSRQLNACPDHPAPGRLSDVVVSQAAALKDEPTRSQRYEEVDALLSSRPQPAPRLAGRLGPSAENLPAGPPVGRRSAASNAAALLEPDAGSKTPHDPVPELIAMLKDPDAGKRARAADELGQLGTSAAAAVDALKACLRDPDPRARASAALALGDIGTSPASVLRLLTRALKDRSADVRHAAALGLLRLGTPQAEKAFETYLRAEARRAIDSPRR